MHCNDTFKERVDCCISCVLHMVYRALIQNMNIVPFPCSTPRHIIKIDTEHTSTIWIIILCMWPYRPTFWSFESNFYVCVSVIIFVQRGVQCNSAYYCYANFCKHQQENSQILIVLSNDDQLSAAVLELEQIVRV